MVDHLYFQMDPHWSLRHLIRTWYNERFTKSSEIQIDAIVYTLNDMLFNHELTVKEIDSMVSMYCKELGVEYIILTGELDQAEQLFKYIFQLDRYKQLHLNNLRQGYGSFECSVIDLRTLTEYETKYVPHFTTLMKIINDSYKFEFSMMDDKEKDDFIISNFLFIGSSEKLEDFRTGFQTYNNH